jgi:hypothetical protein
VQFVFNLLIARSAMLRDTRLADMQERLGLEDGKATRGVKKDKETNEMKAGWCFLAKRWKREDTNTNSNDHQGDEGVTGLGGNGAGEEESRDDQPTEEANISGDLDSPVKDSTVDVSRPFVMY